MILPYLHERRIYLNRRHHTNQFYTLYEHDGKNYILCFCISDSKLYVYTETGILVERILYRDIADKCGKPISISENGKCFIFRKSEVDNYIHLVEVNLQGLKVYKTICLKDTISSYIHEIRSTYIHYKDLHKFYTDYLNKIENLKQLNVSFCLNDSGDVLIRLKPKIEYLEKVLK